MPPNAPEKPAALVPLSLRVDAALKRRLKVHAAREGRTMEQVLHAALVRELAAPRTRAS